MRQLRFLLLLVLFFPFLAISQAIDSLKVALENEPNTELKIDIMNKLAYEFRQSDLEQTKIYMEKAYSMSVEGKYQYGIGYHDYILGTLMMDKGSYDSALVRFKSAKEIMVDHGSNKELVDINNNIGITYKRLGKLDSSEWYYREAFKFINDDLGRARFYANMGSNQISQGKLDSAVISQLKAIEIFERIGNLNGLAIAYLNLGNISYKKEDEGGALNYYKRSLQAAIQANHKMVQARNYLNIGSLLAKNKNYDSAYFYYNQAIPIHKAMNDQTGLAATFRNIGELYDEQDNFAQSEMFLLESNRICDGLGNIEGKIRIKRLLAEIYLKQNNLKNAEQYVMEAVSLSRGASFTHELQKCLDVRHKILSAKGDYASAYLTLMEVKNISDSVFKIENLRQISELQTKYETEKKDQSIASLSQEAQIKDLEINQRNIQLIGAGIILLLLVLGGVVLMNQRKYKHQQAVSDMEQRFLRLQMNPHFIFNALAAIQTYILQNNTKESVSYLAKFGKLMRQILEHSREEFITVQEESDMLRNYLEIQQLRFQNKFDFKIEIDASIDAEEMQIPPLFAQPFVENAIEHGLKEKISGGLVTVRFLPDGKNVRLEIEDNGAGFANAKLDHKTHKSLATVIIKDRLALFEERLGYKLAFEIEGLSQGTLASISLPVG
jgi:tetratricopeptide (TPR) repeat protein